MIFDIAGTSEWLRLRQVCKLFDEAAFSMKNFKVQSMFDAVERCRCNQVFLLQNGLEVHMTELNTIIDVSYNQQMRKIWPPKGKMPRMEKRNSGVKNEFYELKNMKGQPAKVQRLLLVAAIFTQSVALKDRDLDPEALLASSDQILARIPDTTLTRKVFDHHATLQRTIAVLKPVQMQQVQLLFSMRGDPADYLVQQSFATMSQNAMTIFKAFESLFIALTSYCQRRELSDYFRTEQRILDDEHAARVINDGLSQRRLFRRMFALKPDDVSRLTLTAEQ